MISDVHRLITHGIDIELNNPGVYRNHKVQVGNRNHGGVYTPPKCLPDINKLMTVFCEWINSEELVKLYPPIRAALTHYYLGLVHPFGDGNGRTARILDSDCPGFGRCDPKGKRVLVQSVADHYQ
ncbi:MAG: hypothetical protein DRH90_06090 [Deltaproteobacteria bacterium]|nr:MAG: hypothetical protein DRH90_06090 [Deltaproteobacteria bacterium]RLC13088.1 MAG: hypothetical protein DRI24_16415 [Deltaproteobacteria bacterium]